MRADEPGSAGDQHSHTRPPLLQPRAAKRACPVVELPLPELEREQPPDLAAEPRLLVEPLEHLRVVDELRLPRRLRREHVDDELAHGPGCASHSCSGTGKAHLVAARSRIDGGSTGPKRRLQHVLQVPVLELDVGRHGRGKLDDRVIEERHARLEPVRHAHAVLDLQERRQQRLEVEVGHAVEVRLLAERWRRGRSSGTSRTASSEPSSVPVDLVADDRARG